MSKHDFWSKLMTEHPVVAFVFLYVMLSVSGIAQAQSLKIACAANMLSPVKEISALYEIENNITIDIISGASGALATQVINGAPFDIYIAANNIYTNRLFEKKVCQKPATIVFGTMAIWAKDEIPGQDLVRYLTSNDGLLVSIAEPDLAPFGKLAADWLKHEGLWPLIQDNLIYGQNISQVNHFIATKSIDIAFSSNSAMHAASLNDGYWISLGSDHYKIEQTLCQVSENAEVEKFITFLKGNDALKIFSKFGYLIPQDG